MCRMTLMTCVVMTIQMTNANQTKEYRRGLRAMIYGRNLFSSFTRILILMIYLLIVMSLVGLRKYLKETGNGISAEQVLHIGHRQY